MYSSESLRSPITRAMIQYLVSRGIDRQLLGHAAGYSSDNIDNGDNKFLLEDMATTWLMAKELSGDSFLGLHAGEFFDLSALGIVGFLALSSSTLGEAVESVGRYKTISETVLDIDNYLDRRVWKIFFRLQKPLPGKLDVAARQIIDAAMAMTVKALSQLSHCHIKVEAVCFSGPRAADISEYIRIFQSKPFFESQADTLVFSAETHRLPVTFSDPGLHALFENHARILQETLVGDKGISGEVKYCIARRLWDDRLSLAEVAGQLCMSTRTLQRKLERERTTFKALLDEVRRVLASDYLLKRQMSATDTAFLLGFSEPSAFARSFKRWTGMSPGEFQRRNQKKKFDNQR